MESGTRVENMSAQQLVEHRLERSHRPLEERLTTISGLARKVAGVHGAKDAQLVELAEVLEDLVPAIREQLVRERTELLPALIAAHHETVASAVRWTAETDAEIAGGFAIVRRLTAEYAVPAWACRSLRTLFDSLASLDQLHASARLERDELRARLS